MKIGLHFHCKDDRPSGVEQYALGLIRALADHREDDEYVLWTNRPALCSPCAGVGIRRVRFVRSRSARIAWEHFRLLRLARREGVDVLHCPAYVCPAGAGPPRVATVHDTLALDRPKWCTRANAAYYRRALPRSLRVARRIVAVSSATADDAIRCGAPAERIRVVAPAVDPAFGRRVAPDRLDQVRRRYGLPQRYVLYVGNVEPKKNLGNAVRGFLAAGDLGCRLPLVLVGGRRWRCRGVLRDIRRGVRAGRIVSAGYVARGDLPAVYRMARMLLCVSLHEGFGLPAAEAMTAGVPVVCSMRGALAETVGPAGVAVHPLAPAEIAQAIARLDSDEELHACVSTRGLQQAQRYSPARLAAEMRAIYAEAAT